MALPHTITISLSGGATIVLPHFGRKYAESTELITREDRSASGKLKRDIIAQKKTFTLTYDTMDVSALALYEDLLDNHADEVMTLTTNRYTASGETVGNSYDVLLRPFSRQRLSKGLWEGVTVEFVEV
jgi:hypothetical protein